MLSVQWFSLPLQKESLRMMEQKMPHYGEALNKDVTKLFFRELKERAMSRQNCILSIHAAQGRGKSYVGIFIAEHLSKYLGKKVIPNNINFSVTNMLRAIEKAEEGSILILDEQTKTVGVGARAELAMLYNIEDVVRQYKMFLIFISPKYVSHTYHYMIDVLQPGSDKPLDPVQTVESQWKYTKSIILNDNQIPIGFIATGTPSDKQLLHDYEKKKELFIQEIRKRRGYNRPAYLREKIFRMMKENQKVFLPEHGHCSGFLIEMANSRNKELKKSILDMHFDEQLTTMERTSLANFSESLFFTEFSEEYEKIIGGIANEKGKKKGKK